MYGLGRRVDPAAGEGPVIVNAFVNFLRQLEFPGDIRLHHYVANPGRTSVDTFVTIQRTDEPGVLYAEGGAKMVWTDYAARQSRPLPGWFRAIVT
jgi:acyl-CoA thioester hydrolase